MHKKILTYCLVAILAALSIALNYLKIPISTNVIITLYALPLLFAGCCFNWKYSLLTGAITGVILQLTSPYGISVTMIFWALAPIGWVMVCHVLFNLLKKITLWVNCAICVLTSSIMATALNTLAMLTECWFIHDPYYTYASIATDLPSRIGIMAIMIIPYTICLFVLVERVGPLYQKAIYENGKEEN